MKIGKLAIMAAIVLGTIAAKDVAPTSAELESMYDRAFRDLDAANYAGALQELDAIDARKPDLAESQNLRGVILMRQGSYDKAEAALEEAERLDPKLWNASFNLAEIPFQKKDWATARKRFEDLLNKNGSALEGEAVQLIQLKILLTWLLEGNDAMVASAMTKLEASPETPALPYAKAAISLQHQNIVDARSWLATAEKSFSAPVNKLFTEPLVQIGWLQRKPGQQRPVLQLLTPEQRTSNVQVAARTDLEQAQQAYEQRDFALASKLAEKVDRNEPNQAVVLNLRGAIALEQQQFDEAEAFFNKALKVDKNLNEARLNLADVPFREKDYDKARARYEAIARQSSGGDKDQVLQLAKFKIFMTHLLEGKDSRAQKAMEQFQFSGDTPALYYAQAAWEFKHGNNEKANDWITSARKIYPLAANTVYGSGFYDLGWLKSAATAASPAPTAATDTIASIQTYASSPAVEPSPIPGAEAKVEEAAPSAPVAQSSASGDNHAAQTAPATSSLDVASQPVATPTSAPREVPAMASVQPTAAPVTSPAAASVIAAPPSAAPLTNSPAVAVAQPTAVPETTSSPAIASNAPALPAAVPSASAASLSQAPLLPASRESGADSSLRERIGQFAGPNPILFLVLAVSGLAIIVWLAFAQARRRIFVPHLGGTPATASGPALRAPLVDTPEKAAPRQFTGGPRHISVQLTAAEPSVRRGISRLAKGETPTEEKPSFEQRKPFESEEAEGVGEPIPWSGGDVTALSEHKEIVSRPPERPAVSAFASDERATAERDFSESVGPVREQTPGEAPALPIGAVSRLSGRRGLFARRAGSAFAKAAVSNADASSSHLEASEEVGQVREQAPAEAQAAVDPAQNDTPFERADVSIFASPTQPERETAVDSDYQEGLVDSGDTTSGLVFHDGETTIAAQPAVGNGATDINLASGLSGAEQPGPTNSVEPLFAPAPEPMYFHSVPEEEQKAERETPVLAAADERAPSQEPIVPIIIAESIAAQPEAQETFAASESVFSEPQAELTPPLLVSDAPPEMPVVIEPEPVEQGSPVPYLISAQQVEEVQQPVLPPVATPPLDVSLGLGALRETPAEIEQRDGPSFNSQPTPIETMPDTLQTPTAPIIRTPNPPSQPNAHGAPPAAQPTAAATQTAAAGVHTAVQITLSCEIASMQLTPTFKMGALQLRPTSKVVTMRLAPSQQQQQSAMNLQVNFEVAKVQPAPGSLGQIRLVPSQQQKPPMLSNPSFSISGLQLVSGFESAPVQLTPQQQGQASVQVTAAFQISSVEFSAGFDISGILLNAAGRSVSVQLPGAGASTIESAPLFEVANVQLTPNGEIAMLQLSPAGARRG